MNQRITAREWILSNFQNYSKRASCIQECATSLGISVRNARKAMIGVEKSGKVTWGVKIDDSTSEVNFDENGLAHISLLSNIPRSVEDLMAISKLDPELWFVKQQIVNFWGNNANNANYQIKAIFDRKISESGEAFLAAVLDSVSQHAPTYPQVTYAKTTGEKYMLEIDIFDAHIGMQSDTYDTETACSRYYAAVMEILNWYQGKHIEEIVLILGNDLFNSEGASHSTAKSTYLNDDDLNHKRVYQNTFDTLIKSIELCRTVAPVRVISVYGNHDPMRTFYLAHSISAYFSKCDEVTVDISQTPFFFYAYGTNLIGYTHGDIKLSNLPMLMATSRPVLWSASKIRMWRIGHKHHKKTMDYLTHPLICDNDMYGVRVAMCAALADKSFWAAAHGYESIKEATATLWHASKGDISTFAKKFE